VFRGRPKEKEVKRAKNARVAAEAAAEQGDSGLAHPESTPDVKLEGRKAKRGGGKRGAGDSKERVRAEEVRDDGKMENVEVESAG